MAIKDNVEYIAIVMGAELEDKLPKELGEVEHKLNQLRTNLKENTRIAKEAEQRKNDLLVYLAHDL